MTREISIVATAVRRGETAEVEIAEIDGEDAEPVDDLNCWLGSVGGFAGVLDVNMATCLAQDVIDAFGS